MKPVCLRPLSILSLLLAAFLSFSAPAAESRDPDTLQVALLPDENAAKVIQDNQGLKEHLEKQLGKKIDLHVLTSYAAMIEATRMGHIDLAFFGPLSYCLAKDKCAIEPFAAKVKNGSATYTSVIIANAEAGINKLEDIKGKRMAFGDAASTSSHLIPKSMLFKAGLKETDYQENFLGKHDAVAVNVARGNADAGGLSKVIFDSLIASGVVDKSKIKVLAESDPIPEYPWVLQADLKAELKEKIKKAFLELQTPAVLKTLKADGFAPIKDSDYDVIRSAAKLLGKDLGSLEK